MLCQTGKASYLCSPKLLRESSSTNAGLANEKLKKSQHFFGRIEKVVIFALPNKKGVKNQFLR
jgi:hypothetical protein